MQTHTHMGTMPLHLPFGIATTIVSEWLLMILLFLEKTSLALLPRRFMSEHLPHFGMHLNYPYVFVYLYIWMRESFGKLPRNLGFKCEK